MDDLHQRGNLLPATTTLQGNFMTKQTFKGDSLGDRMKGYEVTSQSTLIRRMPVIIRIDGKAFHTYTKRLKHIDPALTETPFSPIMHDAMVATTQALVEDVQNCVFGYTQSDEISLFIRDWDSLETQSWFGNNVQKMVSVSASVATAAFNFAFGQVSPPQKLSDMAKFDSRVYNIPKEEVVNYFIWRQNDASRNSVQMLGHYHFSQKQMHAKSNSQVQDMLVNEKGVNWNDLKTWMKRGSCIIRKDGVTADEEIPIFSKQREYVGAMLLTPDDEKKQEEIEQIMLEL